MIANLARAAGCRPQQGSTNNRQDNPTAKSRGYPRLKVDRSLPGRAEAMTDMAKIRFVGISLQAAYLFTWLADFGGSNPKVDESGRWVVEVKPQHAPTLAEFAALRPGRKGKPTHPRTVKRWLAELVEAGMVEVIRTRTGNGYLLVIPEAAVERRLVRQAKASAAAPDEAFGQGAGLPPAGGQAAPLRGQGCPPGVARLPPRCHDSHDNQDTQTSKRAQPTAHSFQEPGVPSQPGGGGGIDRRQPEGLHEAVEALQAARNRDEAREAVQRAGGIQGLRLADVDRLRALTVEAVGRCHKIATREKADAASCERVASRWLAEAGVAATDPVEAVEALQRVGVRAATAEALARTKPPQVIVEAVRRAEQDPNVKSKAGAVVVALRG